MVDDACRLHLADLSDLSHSFVDAEEERFANSTNVGNGIQATQTKPWTKLFLAFYTIFTASRALAVVDVTILPLRLTHTPSKSKTLETRELLLW
jgi:hypothetical protein